jgi:hypothetical protein
VFDTPKSPFEERMQQQANQLRKTSVCSSDTDNEGLLIRGKITNFLIIQLLLKIEPQLTVEWRKDLRRLWLLNSRLDMNVMQLIFRLLVRVGDSL